MNLFTSLCRRTGLVMAFLLTVAIASTAAFHTERSTSLETERSVAHDAAVPKTAARTPEKMTPELTDASCGCQDQVNVQMRADCTYELTLNQVGAGDCSEAARLIVNDSRPGNDNIIDCPGLYTYGIFDENNDLICWGEVLAEDKTGPRVARVEKTYETIPCVFAEDFTNNPETVNPSSPFYLGNVFFEDNCGGCGCSVETKFFDQLSFTNNCDQLGLSFGEEYVYATLSRRFTATDCNGNETDTTIIYEFVRPDLDNLILLDDVTEQTCNADNVSIPDAFPYWEVPFPTADGDMRLELNEVDCNYAITVTENEFPVCNGQGRKIERYIRVLDWCAGTSRFVDTVVIKIGDFAPPEFKGNAKAIGDGLQEDKNKNGRITANEVIVDLDSLRRLKDMNMVPTISTRPEDCTGAFAIDLNSLQQQFGFSIDDCTVRQPSISILTYGPDFRFGIPTGDSIWREGNYPMINGFAMNVPVGIHAIVMDVADECYNSAQGVVFFQVKDLISPRMQCDDQLNITLSTGGYARVFAADVDEGSRDNCALDQLKVRRTVSQACIDAGTFDMADLVEEDGVFYTPFDDFVEFFCCDAGQRVVIELQGSDASVDPIMDMEMPNTSICWLELLIEDKVDPICTDLPAVTTFCDDPRLGDLSDLSAFGEPQEPFSNCQSFGILELDPIVDLDQCNIGTIMRQYVATGNGEQSAVCTQQINVVARHDYWLRFPADVETDCGAEPDAGTVTFAENACDLMAVSFEDIRFSATEDPDACYKIFRTYRVINWCEYDGEAQPTTVSRDWDAFNGTNPMQPDGDDNPGDEAIFVHVKRNFADGAPDTVYYDNTDDPYDNSVVGPGNNPVGYWWRVISGSNDPSEEAYYEGNGSVWAFDGDQFDSDITGNAQGDDDDLRYGSFGFWEYTQHIVVYDRLDPEITISGLDTFPALDGENCVGTVTFQVIATDLCTDDSLDVSVTVGLDVGNDGSVDANVTNNLNGNIFTADYPIGEHRLVFTADDGCGNTAVVSKVFVVVDGKAPTPICLNGITIELMPSEVDSTGAYMEVWADDFIASDIFDCTGQGEPGGLFGLPMITKENYFIVRDEIEGESEFDPDNPMMGIGFNCNDAGQLIPVEIHTVDAAGNSGFCRTFVQVDDNMGICDEAETAGIVAGSVETARNIQVEGVDMRLSGQREMAYMTGFDGGYRFENLRTGYDYTVTPSLNANARNGVSTADLILIGRHILGFDRFTDPYQYLAADVNADGSVTSLDMLQMRALILAVRADFPGNTSWRFVDKAYKFTNPANPLRENFPEVININNLLGEVSADFVAVKVGDLNGTANVSETRSAGIDALHLYAEEELLKGGETYRIPFYAENLTDVAGFQFTLEVNDLDLIDVEAGSLNTEYFGVFPDRGVVTASWGRVFQEVRQADAPLFYLVVRAADNTTLSRSLRLTSRYTPSEAYERGSMGTTRLQLRVGDEQVSGGTTVYQNMPNPFRDHTLIGFALENSGRVTITLSDPTGRPLRVIERDLDAGYHQVQVDRADIPVTGVVYYTVRAGDFSETRRMLIVK